MKVSFGLARAASLRPASVVQLILLAALTASVGLLGHYRQHTAANTDVAALVAENPAVQQTVKALSTSPAVQAFSKAGAGVAAAIAPQPENTTREAELDDGQTFAELLSDAGASDADATAAMNALSKVYDLRRLQAGQDVSLSFTRTVQQETFTGAVFQPEDTKEISITRNQQGTFTANVKLIPVIRQRLAAQAEITSSLYEAGNRVGVPHALMASLIRIYSHDIDFQRDIHPGDKFEILYDQPTTANGKAVGEGTIVYAAMTIAGKVKPIYRVTFNDKTVEYFDERGQSIRRALLRTPVAAARITSGYGMRVHPLLGYSKMHKGVDFGAPMGAPIFAAGNGTIEDIGFKNGYGRYVRIRHNGQLETAYAHMSRFGGDMYRGAHVNQGQVIGYVGMSGRATGPHLHFEVHINGAQVNPMSVSNMPTGRNLEGKLLADFKQGQSKIKQEFGTLLQKKAPVAVSKGNIIQASAATTAFPRQETNSCGVHGGC